MNPNSGPNQPRRQEVARFARAKPGPKRPERLPECLNASVPLQEWGILRKHFLQIDKRNGMKALHFLLYIWLSPNVFWYSDQTDSIWIRKEDVLDIYGVGKNSMVVVDAIADLRRFDVHVRTGSPSGFKRIVTVEAIEAPQIVMKALERILHYKGTHWYSGVPDGQEVGVIPVEQKLPTKSDTPEVMSTQKRLIQILEDHSGWSTEILEHYKSLVNKAVEVHFRGSSTLLGFRRNIAVLRNIRKNPVQSYSASDRSARIYGRGFNLLSREVRQELERLMKWTVVDLKACQLTIIAYKLGWKEVIKHLESEDGFWVSIVGVKNLTPKQKEPYKLCIQSLLFGRKAALAKRKLAPLVGNKESAKFFTQEAVKEIIQGSEAALNQLMSGTRLPEPEMHLDQATPESRKEACSEFSLWAQRWEMYYISQLAEHLESNSSGVIRSILHDGMSIATDEPGKIGNMLNNKLEELNIKHDIRMKLDILCNRDI